MTAQLIDWDSASAIIDSPTVRIYYKQVWSDPWTEDTRLRCNQVSWTIGGSGYSTATLHLDLGNVFHDATRSVETRSEVNLVGYYICIAVLGNDTTEPYDVGGSPSGNPYTTPDRLWLGYVESQVLRDDGVIDGVKTGEQTFFCFTLDRALMQVPIIQSAWDLNGNEAITTALDYNLNAGQKFANKHDANLRFSPKLRDTANREFWSTIEIVESLLSYTPKNQNDQVVIQFRMSGNAALPDYDQPSLQTYGRDVMSLLNDLVRPGRMLGWVFRPDISLVSGVPVVGNLNCHFFTLSETDLSIGSETLPANTEQFRINASEDPLTEYTFESNGLETAQQVIVHGAKRVTIATLSFDDTAFEDGWSANDLAEYNAGKSADVDYVNQDQETQRRWNLEARNAAKLRNVFSRMLMKEDWDGAGVFDKAKNQATLGNPDDYQPHLPGLRLLSRLPLIAGKLYEGDPAGATIQAYGEATSANDREPFLAFEAPWDFLRFVDSVVLGKAAHLQGTRDGDDTDFSVNLAVLGDDRSVELVVSGGEPHEIAYADFVRLPADPEDAQLSKYDFRKAKLTIAIEEDRYLEVTEPEEVGLQNIATYNPNQLYGGPNPGPASKVLYQGRFYEALVDIGAPAGAFDASKWQIIDIKLDAVRKKLIRAGESYQSIYVADRTITDIAADGTAIRLDRGFLVDDYNKIYNIAKLSAAWYTKNRSELRLTSARINGAILPGSLITTVSGKEVNTVVSSVTIDLPPGGAASMQVTTWYGDIDPVGLLQDAGVV